MSTARKLIQGELDITLKQGDSVEITHEWYNRSNGNSYEVYLNPNNGIQYRNRYMIPSTNRYRKSAKMYQYLLKHHV